MGGDTEAAARCACGTPLPAGARFCPGCGTPLQTRAEVRKLVTVVFCDLVGSTALAERLEAEALRDVLRRHLEALRAVAERHGGAVERLIGDAVLAVFGVPVAHEDDALRALRAAVAMREAVGALNAELAAEWGLELAVRIGVNSGEVVAADPRGSAAVALGDVLGDAVNVAARLQDHAAPGEVLVGDLTRRLAGPALDAQPRTIALRGRREPVAAWSLTRIHDAPAPAAPAPFVGREAELLALAHALDGAVAERRCRLVAVVGDPGVGKSRLARELGRRLPPGARLLRGRCLPYGEGVTFWPFAEVLREAAGVREGEGAGEVAARLRALVAGEPDEPFLAGALGGLLGAGDRALGDDLALALRRLLELLGREAPVVLELDDLQWADAALLDLVESLPGAVAGSAVLVLAVGRPELLEVRPSLGTGDVLALEPLPRHTAEDLVTALLPDAAPELRRRVAAAAQGNPFFAEQLAAAGPETGGRVPPTLGVLLQARLDRLPPEERTLLERAAIVGEEFDLPALGALDVAGAEAVLVRLAARGLVAHRDGGWRFRHLLLRDAAYDRLTRAVRADLHERYALWLDAAAGDRRAQIDAIAAHHLERAARCRMELGRRDAEATGLQQRASARLADAGRAALASGDAPSAIALLDRALRLCHGPAPLLEAELGGALYEDARFDEARAHLARALAGTDERARRRAAVAAGFVRIDADPEPRCEELVEEGRAAAAVLAGLGDLPGAARAWALVAVAHHHRGRQGQRLEALERSIALAREAGESVVRQLDQLASALLAGPTPLPEGRRRCSALLDEAAASPTLEASLLEFLGGMATLAGDAEEGRRLLAASRARYQALGGALAGFHIAATTGLARLFSGEPAAGLHHLRVADAVLAPLGERSRRSTIQALTACAHALLGEDDDALRAAALADELGAPDDAFTQIAARTGCAWVHARAGRGGEAVAHGRAALAAAGGTDAPLWAGLAELALAEGLTAAREQAAAERHALRAEAHFAAKGVPWLRARAGAARAAAGR